MGRTSKTAVHSARTPIQGVAEAGKVTVRIMQVRIVRGGTRVGTTRMHVVPEDKAYYA
ncbi:hypothetical protein GCM10010917_17390 [Paenibacillus physcomitrellae]|uniref:Uncharacterized protein n=1 Tax=Paenibacillus physcomitrellae TaxID=1619311 RepID=A0ABQ1FZ84_9BACL|nr:hypothetical protein GCM10010917_17390 [Paenibacillus physcomitrellae]